MLRIRWLNFKEEVLKLLQKKAEINITRSLDGESYRATLVRLGEPNPDLNRVDLEIGATEVDVKKRRYGEPTLILVSIEVATLPAILQFFIPDFVLEVVRRRKEVVRRLDDLAFLKEYKQKKGEAGRNQRRSLD